MDFANLKYSRLCCPASVSQNDLTVSVTYGLLLPVMAVFVLFFVIVVVLSPAGSKTLSGLNS